MKATLEKIDFGINSSFKVSSYTDKDPESCEVTGWHIHPEYELVYIKNGSGRLRIDHYSKNYKNGALLFLGPHIPHIGFGNNEREDNLEVVIQFGTHFVSDQIAQFPEFKSIQKLIKQAKRGYIFQEGVKNKLSPFFEKFDVLSKTEKLINLLQILDQLSREEAFECVYTSVDNINLNSEDVKRLQLIFDYINTNYHNSFSTKDVADLVGLTTNSFCRYFKKLTNQSFIKFVNEFRIRKAVELLQSPSITVSEIMYQCGYTDLSYFSKQFKKIKGVAPSVYLKNKVNYEKSIS